jgi:translocation and assembly module TamA
MNPARAAAALALALLAACGLSGCAGFPGVDPAGPDANGSVPAALPAPAEAAASAGRQGVAIEIEAPAELKALLERNLDLVRLGRLAREDVDDTEWSRLIEAAPAQVRELLQTEGYFAPQVSLERDQGRALGKADVVLLKVDPGARVMVSRVTLEAEGELERGATAGEPHAVAALQQLRDAWPLPAGKEFRNPAWAEAKAAALARLRSAGYANASWTGTGAEIDTESNEVRLFLVADSGPLFRFGELQVEGLVAHESQTVLNLANAPRGAPVTEALLLDFQERLQKSGLFENISVTLDTDPSHAESALITARVREAPLQTWTFGLGVSANTGPRASVEHTYRRVFGQAATAHNKIEYGKLRKAWDGDISAHAGTDLYRNLVGAAVEELISDTDTVLSQRVRLGRTQDGQRIERLIYLEAERSTRRTDDNTVNTKAIAESINYHGVWRDLDSIVLPTQGVSFSGQVGAGRSHGTDAEPATFGRLYARATGYLPVGKVWYAQGRVELGQVFIPSNGVVPESQQFRAGGDDSVRGYSYRSLGPLVDGVVGSGNVLYTGSLEVARPIVRSLPSLWGAVFIDAGNAGNSFAHLKPAVGMGLGVRWRSPAGPLRLDYAYGREIQKWRLHFSVGIAF